MKLRAELLAVAAACALASPPAAQAAVTERRRGVDVVIHRAYAEVFVMASFTNDADAPGRIDASVGLDGGWVVGFSMLQPEGRWRSASLSPREDAASRLFDAEPRLGAADPILALLSLHEQGIAEMSATIPGTGDETLALQLVLPIDVREQSQGKLTLPSFDGAATGVTHIRLSGTAADGLTGLVVDGRAQEGGVAEVESALSHEIVFEAPTARLVTGDLAMLNTTAASGGDSSSPTVVDYRVDVGSRVGEVPNDAHVVVIVETSRSIRGAARRGAINAARSFVSNFESHRGEVAVVAFDRSAETLTTGAAGPFVSPSEAMDALAALATREARNGSNVDLALAEASRVLDPVGGTRRVVLFTDAETADRIDVGALEHTIPPRALLHVVRIADATGLCLEREDASPWSDLARASGGALWAACVGGEAEAQRPVFEELARPKRLDHVRLVPTKGGDVIEIGAIPEGGRARGAEVVLNPGESMTLQGELWSTPFSQKLEASTDYRKFAVGRLVSMGGHFREVEASELESLATFAHVLSPVTSFLVGERGALARPLDRGSGSSVREGIHLGSIGTLGPGQGDGDGALGQTAILRAVLPLASACSRASGAFTQTRIDLDVETTGDEIVDVGVTGAPSDDFERCLLERTWNLDLDPTFQAVRHRHWIVHTLDTP
ncbi:MAG: vWA domain-containing protein [Polyangiaceae bacterium]